MITRLFNKKLEDKASAATKYSKPSNPYIGMTGGKYSKNRRKSTRWAINDRIVIKYIVDKKEYKGLILDMSRTGIMVLTKASKHNVPNNIVIQLIDKDELVINIDGIIRHFGKDYNSNANIFGVEFYHTNFSKNFIGEYIGSIRNKKKK